MSSTPNSTVEASTTSSSPASCMASNNNAPKYGTRVPNRVFVGGLSGDTTEAEMESLFSSYGQVSSAKIISDRAGVSKGYGFITFETEEQAHNLLRMKDVYMKNRKLNIAPAIKKQSPYGRSYDAPSPNVPNGSVYYSTAGVPYTFQSNGMSYYPAAAAAAAVAAAQQEAYNAAAAAASYSSQPHAQAAAANSYPAYPYMYPAAQAMYAPQQFSYQTVPPPTLADPPTVVSPVLYTNSTSTQPPLGTVVTTSTSTTSVPPLPTSPTLQTQQQQQQQLTYMLSEAAAAPLTSLVSMPLSMLPLNNDMVIKDMNNGDDICGDANELTDGEEPPQIAYGSGQYVIDPSCFSTPPPPPLVLSVTPPSYVSYSDEYITPYPPLYTIIPPIWSPTTPPPPLFNVPEALTMNGTIENNFRTASYRGRGGRGGGRGGGGGGVRGRGHYQKVGAYGDYNYQHDTKPPLRRDLPPRMYNNNNNRQSKYSQTYSSLATIAHEPEQMLTQTTANCMPLSSNNNNDNGCMPPDLLKMVHALQINN